jgi:hypothetical protein
MSGLTRRQLLRRIAAGTAAVAGTVVVLARTVVASGAEATTSTASAGPVERADLLAEELPASPDGLEPVSFLNRAVAARGGVGGAGAFRNAGFANGRAVGAGGGAFRNGGFANGRGAVGGGGAFRNGAFRNF